MIEMSVVSDADESNPWRALDSDVRYTNDWIEVTHHRVVTPGGRDGIYGTVHFKHLAILFLMRIYDIS